MKTEIEDLILEQEKDDELIEKFDKKYNDVHRTLNN